MWWRWCRFLSSHTVCDTERAGRAMSFILFEDIVEVQRVDDKHFQKVEAPVCSVL